MGSYQIRIIRGLQNLAAHTEPWNALWRSSTETLQPTATVDLIRHWIKTFSAPDAFRAIVVEEGGEFIGALPLVDQRKFGVTILSLPTNCWCHAGDLLLDGRKDPGPICQALLVGLGNQRIPFLDFKELNLDSQRWQHFVSGLAANDHAFRIAPSYTVGITHILHDWPSYEASWSSNHRRNMKKSRQRVEQRGQLEVQHITEDFGDLRGVLRQCFELEDRSWKGPAGGSVLRTPGMIEFVTREAQLVAKLGMLDLWLLKLDGHLIAFSYCHLGRGTCFMHKISFDPDFKDLAPGRLLRRSQLQAMHEDPSARVFDSMGVMSQANASWATASYTMGKLVAATSPGIPSRALNAAKLVEPIIRRFREGTTEPTEVPLPGAVRYLETARALDAVAAS